MSDSTQTQTVTAAPVTGSESASSVAAAPAVASASIESTPAVTPAPSEAAKPVAEPAKVEAVTDAPIPPAENILGDTKPAPEKKDAAAKPEGDKPEAKEAVKDDKAKPETVSEKSVAPVYEEFKFPENFTPDKEAVSELTKILGEVEIGKLDHKGYQDFGQKLIDLATKNTQVSIDRYTESLINQHNKTGDEWLSAFKKDPDLGGDNITETVTQLQDAVSRFAGNEAQVKEFRDVMVTTNVGKNPAVIRLIKNMNDTIRKYESEPKNGMVPATKPAPQKVKAHELFYTKVG